MGEQVLEFLAQINSPELQHAIRWIRWPFMAVTFVFVGIILWSMFRTPYLQLSNFGTAVEFLTYRPYGVPKVTRRWRRITRRLDAGTEAEAKLAIIEADTLLDEMVQKMRIKGDTVDERLGNITVFMIPNVEELRNAHQVRNNIVYDPDYRISLIEARRVLEAYERTFTSLDLFR